MKEGDKITVLLVEDDVKLAELITDFLHERGDFVVVREERGDSAVDRILASPPDLVLLDIMLPGLDGVEVCRRVRRRFSGPIIMLTALGEEVDEIVGLEVGADDYLAKPVSPRLLLTRIRAVMRRTTGRDVVTLERPSPQPDDPNQPLICDALVIHPSARVVTLEGEEIPLTTAEFDLLHLLAVHAGKPLDRDQIFQALRGIEWDGLDRSVDQRVRRLREKLGDDARAPRLIKSVRGMGYMLAVSA